MTEMVFSALAGSTLLIGAVLFTSSKDKAFGKGYTQAVRDILQKGDLEISQYSSLLNQKGNTERLKSAIRIAQFFFTTVTEATKYKVSSCEVDDLSLRFSDFIEEGRKKIRISKKQGVKT